MLKIIGRKSSSNVQKVLWACAELDIQYERVDAGREFGKIDASLNPNRRIPVMIEDDFVLWESNTIVRYLADRYGNGTLTPRDRRARADAERWMDWQLSAFGPPFIDLYRGLVRTAPEKRDMALIEEARRVTESHLEMLDERLAKSAFLAGDTLTFGDIPVAVFVYRWYTLDGIERENHANVERWYEGLQQRPGYREFVMLPPAEYDASLPPPATAAFMLT